MHLFICLLTYLSVYLFIFLFVWEDVTITLEVKLLVSNLIYLMTLLNFSFIFSLFGLTCSSPPLFLYSYDPTSVHYSFLFLQYIIK